MTVVSVVATVVYFALLIFWLFMLARLVIDLVRMLARRWRPQGAALVIAEVVFSVTDPPIKAVRRVVPPLRLGNVALDLAWTIVAIAVLILMTVRRWIQVAANLGVECLKFRVKERRTVNGTDSGRCGQQTVSAHEVP